jgi:hypothetical protein
MTSSNHISIVFTRAGDTAAWIAFDERRRTWSAETMVRVTGGIRYREREYGVNPPTVEQLRKDAIRGGFFSQRPVYPGVPVDPSMVDCALAVFVNFCSRRGIDGAALLEGRPMSIYRGPEDLKKITEQAEWEGVQYPDHWNDAWISMLANLLDAVCYEDLATLVASTLPAT